MRFPVRHLFQREGALVIGGENFRVRASRIRRGAAQVAREGAVELLIAIVRRHGALPSENVSGTVSCRNSRRFLSAKAGFAGLLLRKQIPEINGSIFGGVLKAKRNFRFAEGRFAMQMFLDTRAQFMPNAFQIARDAGLVFADLAADFRQGLLPRIVQLQTLAITAIERGQGKLQGGYKSLQVAFAMRVQRRRGYMAFWKRLGLLAIALIEGFPAAALAKAIDVALRQYGTQPCFQRTPPVKIAEERSLTTLAIHQAE